MVTVSGPVTWMLSTGWNAGPVRSDAFCFSKLSWSAAAFSGVPSWNAMPGRKVIV
jgi:hypothetical protein